MKRRLLFILNLILGTVVLSCSPKIPEKLPELRFGPDFPLPNVAPIAPGLFIDKYEVAVVEWKVYLKWLRDIHGIKSPQFQAALPSREVWGKPYRCLEPLGWDYFMHPNYSWHPIVGVSRAQVLAFALWRADRLMEGFLSEAGLISPPYDPGPRNHFTIQRYLSGKYRRYKPHPEVTHYIHYRLPTVEEWEKANAYNDSLFQKFQLECDNNCEEPVNAGQNPCVLENAITLPVARVRTGVVPGRLNTIRHIKGNVGEWSAAPGISLGGSWFDTPEAVKKSIQFRIDGPNAWTGFRLVAEWRPIFK